MELKFIRLISSLDTEWEYEERTDVWVFGDVDGYRYLQEKLDQACETKQNIHVEIVPECETSMQCVILPAIEKPMKRPKLKLVERKIYKNNEPEMELVLVGNKIAYRELSEELDFIIENYIDRPDEHLHFEDWWNSWVVKRSVSLNIRGPLSSWSEDKLMGYESLILDRQPSYFPGSFSHMTKELYPYEEPVAGESPYILR